MKKRIFKALAAMVAVVAIFTSCDKQTDMVITFDALPSAAQATITEHFDSDKIMLVTYDKELFDKEYVVIFTDGTTIEFNKSGTWESIESNIVGIPTSILPTTIATYIETNYSSELITAVEIESNGYYEVTIGTLIELEFNKSGVLVDVNFE